MSHAPSSNSGFSVSGLLVLIAIVALALCVGANFLRAEPPKLDPSPVPTPAKVKHKHHHRHGDDCECKTCKKCDCDDCDDCKPTRCCKTCKKSPCCCPVTYPPQPEYFGEVDGFTAKGAQCGRSFDLSMGGSRQYAKGAESVMNAQLIHSRALDVRTDNYNRANCTTAALMQQPKEIIKEVIKPVAVPVLTVPVPTYDVLPRYTVLGPDVVLDHFGRRWYYRHSAWGLYGY